MRQRMVKPDFFDSESIRSCSWGARITFIGLMLAADDTGNLRLSLGRLRGLIFEDECDDDQFASMLAELEAVDCIRIYTVDGKCYINLPNFLTYQTINRPTKSTIPQPRLKRGTNVLKKLLEFVAKTAHGVAHGMTHGAAQAEINKEINKEMESGADADAAPIPFDAWMDDYKEVK